MRLRICNFLTCKIINIVNISFAYRSLYRVLRLGSSRTFGYSSNILFYCYFFFFTGIVRGHRGVARSVMFYLVCLGEALQGSKTIG
ncbi:unnamed protein product [Rhizophagus irregularis]|nr:unnamed protein product [Rhizophagus irregularis]